MSAHEHPHHPDHGHAHDHGHGHAHDHDHDPSHDEGLWGRLKHALTPHSHDHTDAIQTAEQASAEGIRASWISLVGMAITAGLQIVIVAISGSVGLLADTLHNLGDLATTIPLIIAFRIGRRAPTRRFPFGFRRAEDLVGLLIAGVIALSAGLIIWESVKALSSPRPLTNLGWVFAAGIVGALGNEAVAWYRIRAGRRIGSAALIAEGQHARTDALTSIAVVGGVAGAWLGFPQADAVVGLLIAAVIIAVLVNTVKTTVHRLMDGIDHGTLDRIEAVASATPGVRGIARARARWSGHRLEADLDVTVDPTLSVAEGHAIATEVHRRLAASINHLDRASVHVEPDGVECGPSLSPAGPGAAAG